MFIHSLILFVLIITEIKCDKMKCKMVPIETKTGELMGHCCVFTKNITDILKIRKQRIDEILETNITEIKNNLLSGNKTNQLMNDTRIIFEDSLTGNKTNIVLPNMNRTEIKSNSTIVTDNRNSFDVPSRTRCPDGSMRDDHGNCMDPF